MGWLKKLVGKEETHEEWLVKHPGKGAMKTVEAAVSDEEQAAMRSRMEQEMRDQGEKMRSQ
ncbi:MAG: hypothetical protein ACKVT1_10485 [Dehalococcoidia bacterium]